MFRNHRSREFVFTMKHTAEEPLYVIFPPAITRYAFEAAETVSEYIAFLSGIAPVRTCEPSLPEGRDAIVLGSTALPENAEALSSLNYGECRISAWEHGLMAASRTDETLPEAAERIIDSLYYEDGTLQLTLEESALAVIAPGYLSYIPVMEAGTVAAVRSSSRQCSQVVISDIGEPEYAQYIKKCEENGFTLFQQREVCGNLFTRMIFGACSLYVTYTPFNRTARLLCEPYYNMHQDCDGSFAPVCEPLMTVIGARFSTTSRYLNCDSGAGNMGYVFRLADGRFILADGGMELGDYAEKIMDTLRGQAPDPSHIVIACWFLSHTHIDHTGAFLKIAEKYASELTVEEIAYNFPSFGDAEAFREAWNTRRVSEAAYHSFPGARVTKLHTGEMLTFGDASVEVLYSQDDLVKQYFSVLNDGYTWNTTSLAIRLTVGGSTVFLPADSDEVSNGIMLAMYGNYLKSDILQVCHHGGWGGRTDFYAAVDPELAIFSTSDELLPKYLQIKYNHDLVYDMHVREVHNNADRCRTFALPYHPEERRIPEDPRGELLYTKAKQLEALASIDNLRKEQLGK